MTADERALLTSLLAIRGFGVLSVDRDGQIIVCNEVAAEILGATSVELCGRRANEFCELSDNGALIPNEAFPSAIAIRTGMPHDAGVMKITRRDGTHRWIRAEAVPVFDGSGTVDRVLVTMTDTTASHEVEQALRVQRLRLARAGDRFRRVLESVPDAIAVYHDTRLGYANQALLSLFGYASITDLVGKEVTKILPGHTPLARRVPRSLPELREESWRRIDGTVAVVEVAGHSIDLDGEEATLLIARDITERKRSQMELVQSTRLASLGTLAAGVAHEINNPLTYVIANLDLITEDLRRMRDGIPADAIGNLIDMADDARIGAETVRKIVRGLKIFSRGDEERRITLDLKAVMNVSINMAYNEIRHRAQLVKDYRPVPPVSADEGRLGQVFINLLVNAAQAIPEGSVEANTIRIITMTDDAGRAVVEISDTGAGIPQDVLERIFDPFFTTKPIGIGTGLGLSICHGLVLDLGGELRVESTVGKGTTFRVILPAATGKARPAVTSPPVLEEPRAGRRGTVLIIDDDKSVAEAVRKVLSREHEVVVVNEGQSALDLIARGATFDIILCDLMMPEMTGMAFYDALEAAAPALIEHIVFITGGAFSPDAGAFLDRVPNQRLDKPFDFRVLRKIVREFVPDRA